MREVIITQILYGFDQKSRFFEGWYWFKFNNLRLVLEILQQYAKGLKLKLKKCWWKLVGGLFALSSSPILNRVKNELTDARPEKIIKKERNRFHCYIACSVEVICIAILIALENMFVDTKISCFYLRGNRGKCAVELACLEMLHTRLRLIKNPHNPQITIK